MKYICVDKECGEYYFEERLPRDCRCVCGEEIDELVECKWCGKDCAERNTFKGVCDDCWEEDKERIKKELFNK